MWAVKWKKWRQFDYEQKRIWFKAAICLILIKLGLHLIPFEQFRKIFKWFAESSQKKSLKTENVATVCWAVSSAAFHLPFSLLCLPQALAAKYLLRHERDLKVHIGVLINEKGDLEAHAWVECKHEVVLGYIPDKNFQPIWIWE